MLRDYQVNDLSQMCRIWNAVVAQGNAFPQLEQLDEQSGDVFFSSQSKTRVCIVADFSTAPSARSTALAWCW